jgi:hypothetical protein
VPTSSAVGGREAERARAGDDEHGDGGRERERRALAGPEPEAERRDREGDDDRHEDAGDAVGQALDRRLAGLRVLDQARDLRERRVGADLRGLDDEASAGVDGRARDLRAGSDLDGHGLAREHAHVDGRGALLDDAVGGDFLTRSHDEAVADLQLLDGDAALGPVGVEDGDVLGAELEQRLQRGAGAALGLGFEVAPGEQEGGDDAGRLEVDLVGALTGVGDDVEGHPHVVHAGVADEQRIQRPQPGGQDADGHERVHRCGAVLEVRPGRPVERPRRPQHDRGHELQREPLEVVELQRRHHRHQQRRHRQQCRDDEPVPQWRCLVVVGGILGVGRLSRGQHGLVAGGLDGAQELLRGHRARVELDPGLLGRVVDGRGHAFELVQLALDAVRARRARHARDGQFHVFGGGAHRETSWVKAAVWTRPSVWNCRNRR